MANDTELRLRRIAAELSGRSPSGSDLGRDYGLDSLDVIHFVSAVEKEFGIQIPDEDLTAASFATIESVAAVLIRVRADAARR